MNNNKIVMDRRKGPDFWVKWVNWIGIFVWIIVIAIITITDIAKPQVNNFFERALNVQMRTYWNINLMQYAFYLLLFLFTLCIFTIVINIIRHRRKTDRFNPIVITFAVLSFLGIIIYITNF
jgi:hypothetical protein